ncbi:unnamed protein product [Phaedon cochleariae]|uniref:Uncharacterized protein n=1 Tax=Phaedon cochleariae TaxID=80249 RepID=A0A9N9X4J5_PHACE|nr:unnamed protein product [Phaedon cochleariae]
MDLKKAIPSYIVIAGNYMWVTYNGQQRTCRRCNATSHEIKDCDKALNVRIRNYASAVSNSLRAPIQVDESVPETSQFTKLNVTATSSNKENDVSTEREQKNTEDKDEDKEVMLTSTTSSEEIEDEQPERRADGLLILKKMRGNYAEPDDVPPFKPLEPTGPSFGTIAGKLFSASSSLDPHKPELFGNTASGHIHHESNNIIPEEHGTFEHKIPVPTTSYGTPFEQPPGYLDHNFGDYTASDSKNKPSYVKADGSNKNDPAPNPDSEYVQPLVSGSESTKNSFEYATMYNTGTLNNPHGSLSPNPIQDQNLAQNNYQFSSANELVVSNSDPTALDLPNLADYPDGFPPSTSNTQSAAVQTPSVDINGELSAIYFQQSPSTDSWPQIIKPSPFLQTPILSHMPNIAHSPPRLNTLDLSHSSTKHRMKSSSYKRPIESKGLSSFRTYRPSSNSFEVVKSMSFELGPNGPKRLT